MNSKGFEIKDSRFSLKDPEVYFLEGWLAEGAEVSAYLDGEETEFTVTYKSDKVDEAHGGKPVRIESVVRDVRGKGRTVLNIYIEYRGVRTLFFHEPYRDMIKYYDPIVCILDEYEVNLAEGEVRVRGWACAKEPVSIRLYDARKKRIHASLEKSNRIDVAVLFDEVDFEACCGFYAVIKPIPERCAYMVLRTKNEKKVLYLPISKARQAKARVERVVRKSVSKIRREGIKAFFSSVNNRVTNPAMHRVDDNTYLKAHLPNKKTLREQSADEILFDERPLISLIVPMTGADAKLLGRLVRSVRNQSYSNWELILAGKADQEQAMETAEKAALDDSRIKLAGACAVTLADACNAGIGAADGGFIAFAEPDGALVLSAFYEVAKAINESPEADLFYTDEDKIKADKYLIRPNMKPDYSPDLETSVNYIGHLTVVRRKTAEAAGSFDGIYGKAAYYDYILRLTEKTDKIHHITKSLYHGLFIEESTEEFALREAETIGLEKKAIKAHYDRLGWPCTVEDGEVPGTYRTTYHWPEKPPVSILIPSKDHFDDLTICVNSILEKCRYENYEIVVIENNSTEEETFEGYKELEAKDPRIHVIYYEGGFNFSRINNFGGQHCKGEYLLLLNNDTEFISDAVTEMMGFAMRPDVGAVGARLYYNDETIQHAGVIMGWGGVAGHAFVNQPWKKPGYQNRIVLQQDYSAVTAACMMVRRDVLEEVGWLSEDLAVAFNDIDLCMKIRRAGYLIVYNPFAELFHYESKSRGLEDTPAKLERFQREKDTFQKKWPDILRDGDPYYSPNLTMVSWDFSLKRSEEEKK